MILLNILEEHFEEADFLWQQRGNALISRDFNLDDLADLEERLLAHLDGLVLAEKEGWNLLEPKLTDGEVGEVFTAAFVALESGNAAWIEQVRKVFCEGEDDILNGIRHALRHTNSPEVDKIVQPLLAVERSALRATVLDILSFRRVPIKAVQLQLLLSDKDSTVVVAAINAVGRLQAGQLKEQIEQLLTGSEPAIRLEAMRTGLLLGSKRALDEIRMAVEKRSDVVNGAPTLVGLAGHGEDLRLLVDALSEPALTRSAITSIGLLGNIAAMDPLIRCMPDPKLSRLAGEAICNMTGVNLKKENLLVEKPAEPDKKSQPDDEDDDVPNDSDEGLPFPDPDKLAAWWQKNSSRLDKKVRYRNGQPYGQQVLIEILQKGPFPERHHSAFELALINPSHPFLETSAFVLKQRKDMRNFNSI